ncbi:hypothetical protein Tco_0261174 [Tanacetum coccineum]
MGTASNHSQTSLGESGEDQGYPQPNRDLESAHLYLISFVRFESTPGIDTLRFITPDVNPKNSRLSKDLQQPAYESNVAFDQAVNMKVEESPFDTESKIKFIEKVDLNQEMKDNVDINFMGSSSFDQVMEEANSDLESIPDD